MRTLLLAGLIGTAGLAAMPAAAQQQAAPTVGPVVSHGGPMMARPNWGHRINGRWWGGVQAPGGWGAYHRPFVGFVLPGYWLQPSYYITDYRTYGLPAPAAGYGWSRYYDDAVLTDRYGRVYDSRPDYDWDRHDGYDEDRRDNGGRAIAGAAIGGVTGGLLGSAVAGRGSRTEGAIIGAGVGAIAGAAIADATAERRYADAPGYRHDGRGDWQPSKADRRLAREAHKQRRKFDRMAREAGYPSYEAYYEAAMRARDPHRHGPDGPHWAMRGGPERGPVQVSGATHVESHTTPGYYAAGYYFPGTTVTTITLPATVTTTTKTYVTEVASRPAGKKKIVKRKIVRADCRCN